MSQFQGARWGGRAFPLVAAGAAVCFAYLLVALRFGDPLRQARQAAADARNLREAMPNAVEEAVSARMIAVDAAQKRLDEAAAGTRAVEEQTKARLAVFEGQIAAMRSELERANALASQTGLELQSLKLAGISAGVSGSGGAVLPLPAPEYRPGTTTPSSSVTLAPPAAAHSAREGPLRLDIVSARATSRGIVLDCTMTRERGGDGRVRIKAPSRQFTSYTRAILADGTEMRNGHAGKADGVHMHDDKLDLIEGVPSKFQIIFSGNFRDAVLCKRIQVEVYYREGGADVRGGFTFSDVLASP